VKAESSTSPQPNPMQFMRRSRSHVARWVYGVVSLCAFASASAQRGAVFRGLVTDSARTPIPGVEVTIREVNRVARTDSAGVFVFRAVPPGTYNVLLRHPQFHPLDGTVRLSEGDSIDYRLPRMRHVAAVLDTVRVNDKPLTPWWQSDFERRRASARGTFMTRDVLDERASWPLTNIIASKAAGIRLVQRHCGAAGSCGWALASSRPASCLRPGCSPLCFLAVWLDGQPIFFPTAAGGGDGLDLTKILPSELAAVEVYTGVAAIPPEFNMTGSACGVIALWSRTIGTGPKQ
jgi:Carboxypeptidase regulatory-like domain